MPRKTTFTGYNFGSDNGAWMGDRAGRISLHEYIRNRIPKPEKCPQCNKKGWLDLANISQEYKREISDWEWLCRRCHMIKDGRIEKARIMCLARRKETKKKNCIKCNMEFICKIKHKEQKFCSQKCSLEALHYANRKM